MPFRMGMPELMAVLAIVLVLFGVGRIGKIGGELGKGIREFRRGVKESPEQNDEDDTPEDEVASST